MLKAFARALHPWRELRRFKQLSPEERTCVFYAESALYWIYLKPVVLSLIKDFGRRICYVTSDREDPLLTDPLSGMLPFYIGSGVARVILFSGLEARVAVMTLPDLGLFQIKRSGHPVHYVYLHHSIVSTHMIYRRGAFDQFDSILCVGPHHVEETRQWEKLQGLPSKELLHHGYGPLDQLLAEPARSGKAATEPKVLVAPSWGAQGLLETQGRPLVASLLEAGYHVTVRPHPRTDKLAPEAMAEISASFAEHPRFAWDREAGSKRSFLEADVMVSDWSGAAFEFALGRERPVLFVDVARKVQNTDYGKIEAVPVEVSLRETLGAVLTPSAIAQAPAKVEALLGEGSERVKRLREARARWVYNPGKSGRAGAEALERLMNENPTGQPDPSRG